MEVKKSTKLANQFWPEFFKRKVVLIILLQIIISILVGITLIFADILMIDPYKLWGIVVGFFIVQLTINLLVFIASTAMFLIKLIIREISLAQALYSHFSFH